MSGKGTGGGTSFEDMSHEQMLAWLDQANAGTVQGAADRLIAAAKEIRKIAEELKVRPQYVEWKGKGADAFRTWSGDLANSALRLGDFSEGAAKWLGEASGAIATAQASIPRDTRSAQANLDAAQAAHNDPDAAAVSSKSTSELAALAADKEKVRQEAAAQMRKLGQTYSLSATQLDGLERPKFPPPPTAIQPTPGRIDANEVVATGGSGAGTSTAARADEVSTATESHRALREVAEGGTAAANVSDVHRGTVHESLPELPAHVGTEIDGTTTTPQAPTTTTVPGPGGVSAGERAAGGTALPLGTVPPALGRRLGGMPVSQTGPGRAAMGGRSVSLPGQGASGPASTRGPASSGTSVPRSPVGPVQSVVGGRAAAMPERGAAGTASGRPPMNNGIVGGRPAAPATAQPTSRLPRGTVVGSGTPAPGATGRGSVGQATGAGTRGTNVGRGPVSAERRGVGSAAESGIVGGRPQQQGRPAARSFTSGGSGLVRGQGLQDGTPVLNGTGRTAARPNGTGGVGARADGSRPSSLRRSNDQNARTQNRAQGQEETGRQSDDRRTIPPFAD